MQQSASAVYLIMPSHLLNFIDFLVQVLARGPVAQLLLAVDNRNQGNLGEHMQRTAIVSRASSSLPCLTSQRGDSGTHPKHNSCRTALANGNAESPFRENIRKH